MTLKPIIKTWAKAAGENQLTDNKHEHTNDRKAVLCRAYGVKHLGFSPCQSQKAILSLNKTRGGECTLQLLGYVAKTVLATMKPIPGNDRVLLFYGNTLNINCSVTGRASLKQHILFSELRCWLPSALTVTGWGCAQELDFWRFHCRTCWPPLSANTHMTTLWSWIVTAQVLWANSTENNLQPICSKLGN